MKQNGINLGVAWYRKDEWQLLRSTAADREMIEETYEEWLECAEKGLKKLKKQGLRPVKIDFNVDEFNDWCKTEDRIPDSDSRSFYAADLLRRRDKGK